MPSRRAPAGTVPMFDLPDLPKPPAPKATPPASAKVVWTIYRPKNPVPCDHCKQVQVERQGDGLPKIKERGRR